MKPMELNVMEEIQGEGLFLYDTSFAAEDKEEASEHVHLRLLEYGYGVLDGRELLMWALQRIRQKIRRRRG